MRNPSIKVAEKIETRF